MKLWNEGTSKPKEQGTGGTAGGVTGGTTVEGTTGPAEVGTSVNQPYRPPAARSTLSGSAVKRKERSIPDSEGEDSGHISKIARSKGPLYKVYGATANFTPNVTVRPPIQKGIVHHARGLTRRVARTQLRIALQDLPQKIEILAIQEHKIRAHKLDFFLQNVWPTGKIFAEPASDGVHALQNPYVTAGKGGVSLAVSDRIATMVTRSGRIANRAVWVHLDGEGMSNTGILAVYAPNTAAERAMLWEQIRSSVDCTRAWVVLGDFNMITRESDQAGGSYAGLNAVEKVAWEALVTDLRLEDYFERRTGTNWFSWDNLHKQGPHQQNTVTSSSSSGGETTSSEGRPPSSCDRILKRLDRIYLSEEIVGKQDRYEILDSTMKSDHAPVFMSLTDRGRKEARRVRFCMNVSLLRASDFKTQVLEAWKATEVSSKDKGDKPEVSLKKCLREAGKLMKARGKQVAKQKRAKWEESRGRIRQFTLLIQENPKNQEVQTKLQEAKEELAELEKQRAKWVQLKLDTQWMKEGDLPTKLFFGLFKAKQKQLEIGGLMDEAGIEVQDEEGMCETAAKHFQILLREDKADEDRMEDTWVILSRIRRKISKKEQQALALPLTEAELKEAAVQMKKGRSPGPDGAPVEFFVQMWETTSMLVARLSHKERKPDGCRSGLTMEMWFYSQKAGTLES
ncbi:hypothetical protein R1sor_022068 [Riccia sorocarpa]|uniref:Endonuclease/exonuclease/phosphatase domain-containing protein n=1 Tax=Riccia sorocarpa TaxID=122646 RepID=A0ABD3GIS8_9MARC